MATENQLLELKENVNLLLVSRPVGYKNTRCAWLFD